MKNLPKKLTPEEQEALDLEIVSKYADDLEFIERQTDAICLAAVNKDGLALRWVDNQTEEICLAAVLQDVHSLREVKKQTGKICLEVVSKDGLLLHYIKNQTEQICIQAVNQNIYSLSSCQQDHQKIVNQIDVDRRYPNGYTPLISTAFSGNSNYVGLLLEAGADCLLLVDGNQNFKGKTASEVATMQGHHDIAAMINAFVSQKVIADSINAARANAGNQVDTPVVIGSIRNRNIF